MTHAVYTVGKAPIVHGIFDSAMQAWQAWDCWRRTRVIPQRATVWCWPNGMHDDTGRVLLDDATKAERPAIIEPYRPEDMPAVRVIATKADVARLLPSDEPMSASSIGATFANIEDHVRGLEEQLATRDERIAELEVQIAGYISRANVAQFLAEEKDEQGALALEMVELRARLDRLENKTTGRGIIGGIPAPNFPDLLAGVSQAMNGEASHG